MKPRAAGSKRKVVRYELKVSLYFIFFIHLLHLRQLIAGRLKL